MLRPLYSFRKLNLPKSPNSLKFHNKNSILVSASAPSDTAVDSTEYSCMDPTSTPPGNRGEARESWCVCHSLHADSRDG
jgi:hypothetical protein